MSSLREKKYDGYSSDADYVSAASALPHLLLHHNHPPPPQPRSVCATGAAKDTPLCIAFCLRRSRRRPPSHPCFSCIRRLSVAHYACPPTIQEEESRHRNPLERESARKTLARPHLPHRHLHLASLLCPQAPMSVPTRVCSRACLVDVATNLTDPVFHGVDWAGKILHDDDFELVLQRADEAHVGHIVITGTNLVQCEQAIHLCRKYAQRRIVCTVGVHPAHSYEFARPFVREDVQKQALNSLSYAVPFPTPPEEQVSEEEEERNAEARLAYLVELIEKNRDVVVAVGEIGIDYAELSYCPRDVQEKYFRRQLQRFRGLGLPFVFHSRDCGMRFVKLLEEESTASTGVAAVVHSFNGSAEEQEKLLKRGFYLSVNGSAFREEELAKQVLRIPLDRLMLETDAPWCDIRSKDFGYSYVRTHYPTTKRKRPFVMGVCLERRNEPCHLVQVVEVYAGLHARFAPEMGLATSTKESITAALHENAVNLFHLRSV